MRKRIWWIVCGMVVGVICCMIACDLIVSHSARGRMYDEIESVPHRKVGLLLGTSPISTWTGRRNLYFDARIKAASDLYNSGKIDWLIVSGGDYRNTEDNGYDEPVAMRDSLIKMGVDSAHIILDYDGTRTLNSIAKVRDVYRQDSILIISQAYHNERALYQAEHLDVDAIAYNADTPVGMSTLSWWRNRGREVLARVKLFMDMARNVQTTRPLGNTNQFRALCRDADGLLAIYETQGIMTFGNFINALLSQSVTEAIYTDMGQDWNYCFYRENSHTITPQYLHPTSPPYASNFVVIRVK